LHEVTETDLLAFAYLLQGVPDFRLQAHRGSATGRDDVSINEPTLHNVHPLSKHGTNFHR
jgi:hypothetical protein